MVSSTLRPHFTRRKDPVLILQEAGRTPGPVWTGAENVTSTGIRSPDRPARSESVYRLSYPGPSSYQQYDQLWACICLDVCLIWRKYSSCKSTVNAAAKIHVFVRLVQKLTLFINSFCNCVSPSPMAFRPVFESRPPQFSCVPPTSITCMEQGDCILQYFVFPSATWSSYWTFSSETSS